MLHPTQLTVGYYHALNVHTGEACIVYVESPPPELRVSCPQCPLRNRIKDYEFLARVAKYLPAVLPTATVEAAH